MAGGGWIKLYRSIQDHWIWDNPVYLKWWLDLLLMANHSEKKILFDGKLVVIGIGERITSEKKLSERWEVSRSTVRKFLNLLVSDEMLIIRKSRKSGTWYKVCNYADYQGNSEIKKHQSIQPSDQLTYQPTVHESDIQLAINKNEKKEKNDKNRSSPSPSINNININVFQEIEKNFGRPLSPIEIETVGSWQSDDHYPDELVLVALHEAVLNQAYSLKYMDRILLNWERKGIKSKQQAFDVIKKRREASVQKDEWEHDDEPLPKVTLHNWLDPTEDENN
ncbi:DnaD domain protein [Enterococcus larvae]|uniref:DnaD domain protein n=1 Tax=Enterococcus larvae TaxID=2794352 RepID=UPI003F32C584